MGSYEQISTCLKIASLKVTALEEQQVECREMVVWKERNFVDFHGQVGLVQKKNCFVDVHYVARGLGERVANGNFAIHRVEMMIVGHD